MDTNSTQLCRLCLQACDHWVNLFENFQDSTVASILSQHFLFLANESVSECICQICWANTIDFHNFYKKIESLHRHSSIKVEIISCSDLIKQQECESSRDFDLDIVKYEVIEHPQSCDDNDYYSCNQNENVHQFPEDDQYTNENDKTKGVKLSSRGIEYESSNGEYALNKSHQKISRSQSEKDKEDAQIREYFTMKCDMCSDFRYETFAEARKHYRKVHNINGHLNCCNRRFHRRYTILNHIRYHLNPDVFRCDTCSKQFQNKDTLQIHVKNHRGQSFECDLCLVKFTTKTKEKLKIHMQNHHSSGKGETCHECNKSFRSKRSLGHHIRNVHRSSADFVCEICARAFKTKVILRNHMEQHSTTAQPKVQCNVCGAWLKNIFSLRHHQRQHQVQVDVNCPQCNKVFHNNVSLKSHIRYVHGERRYQCTLCDKAFKAATILKEHIAIHTGEYLYDCPHCDKKFKSGANMHSHRKKAHFDEWSRERRR